MKPLPNQQPKPKIPPTERQRDGWICLALAVITLAVFAPTLTHDFVNYDDSFYVYENPVVSQGLTWLGVKWAFSTFHADNWHPLTWLSHMLDCQLYGLRPAGHHLTSLLLHTATVLLLYLVLRRMTGAPWRSAFVAAVFAIHPLRVESVAWLAERKDVLSGLFFMLTLWAYLRHAENLKSQISNLKFYRLSLLFFVLGLLSKPMLVTLPLVLLLLDYWPLRRTETFAQLLKEKAPMLALSVVSCVVTLLAQSGAVHSGGAFAWPYRLENALISLLVYLRQMVWPVGLVVLYPFPKNGLPGWEVALAAMVVAGVSALAFWQRKPRPWLAVGWFWYLVMLAPVLGIIQVGGQAHADRYTYLPQIGIYLAVIWLAGELPLSRAAVTGLMLGVLGMLMACSAFQVGVWQDSESLWTYTLASTTDNDVADDNFGLVLLHKGDLNRAIDYFHEAIRIKPDSAEAHNNLGNALLQLGKVDESLAECRRAVELRPDDAEAHANLGNALFRKGKTEDAIVQFHMALQLNPGSAMAHNNLGAILLQKGAVDDAMAEFELALRMKPSLAEAHYNFAKALVKKNDEAEAILQMAAAAQFDRTDPRFANGLAWMLATSRQPSLRSGEQSLLWARQANELTGGKSPDVLGTLAAAYAETGQFAEARQTAENALVLAQSAGRKELVDKLTQELRNYEAGQPYHQP